MERILFHFWSVIFMVISSGWNPGSMVPRQHLPLSHILAAAAVSSPVAMAVSSSTRDNSGKETITGKYNNPGEGIRKLHPSSPMSDVKAVAGQSLQLLCPIVLGSVLQDEDIAQEPIYWMKGKPGTFFSLSLFPSLCCYYLLLFTNTHTEFGRSVLTENKELRRKFLLFLLPASNHFFPSVTFPFFLLPIRINK